MKKLHIFKTGTHTDSRGHTLDFTEADLQAAIAAYDPTLHEAPLVVGHPSDNAPAYGWVQSLSFSDGNLYATPTQVDHDFSEMVEGGKFKKRSASFYPPTSPNNPKQGSYYLRHVGFLGAQPPAIKGLKPVEFSDADDCITLEVDFAENPAASEDQAVSVIKRIINWAIGASAADFNEATPTTTPAPTQAAQPSKPTETPETPTPSQPVDDKDTPTMSDMTPEEIAALKAENEQLKKDKADADAKQAAEHAKAKQDANAEFAESLVNDGKLVPADKDLVVGVLNGLDAANPDTPLEFGEGDAAVPLVQAFKDKLSNAQPNTLLFGEVASKSNAPNRSSIDYGENVDPDRAEADRQVREYMEANNVDYATAANVVLS